MATPRELSLAIESIAEVLTTDNCLHVFRAILDVLNTEEIMRVSRRTRDIGAIRLTVGPNPEKLAKIIKCS